MLGNHRELLSEAYLKHQKPKEIIATQAKLGPDHAIFPFRFIESQNRRFLMCLDALQQHWSFR